MIERAYTLSELDRLTKAARIWYDFNSSRDVVALEERVRTLMIAGIAPEEIEASARKKVHEFVLRERERRAR